MRSLGALGGRRFVLMRRHVFERRRAAEVGNGVRDLRLDRFELRVVRRVFASAPVAPPAAAAAPPTPALAIAVLIGTGPMLTLALTSGDGLNRLAVVVALMRDDGFGNGLVREAAFAAATATPPPPPATLAVAFRRLALGGLLPS